MGGGDFRLTLHDRGVTHGLGLFETVLGRGGRLPLFERHAVRLRAGCNRLKIAAPEHATLLAAALELLERNQLTGRSARLKITVSAGEGEIQSLASSKPGIWITAQPLIDPPPSLRLTISPWIRNERSPLAGLKCTSYAENLCAMDDAKHRGFDEALQFNTRGQLCEAVMANVFLVRDGTVLTPSLDAGCLPGVMRGLVLKLCSELGVPAREGAWSVDDLATADEIFLTSALRGVAPAASLDQRLLDAPGPVSQRLKSAVDGFLASD